MASVYLDDIVCSSDDPGALSDAYRCLLDAVERAKFQAHKLVEPSEEIRAFNCDIRFGYAVVTADRVAEFYDGVHSAVSVEAFEHYREKVASRNM